MSVVNITCTKCAEKIQFNIDKQKGEVFCPYCGNRMDMEATLRLIADETQKTLQETPSNDIVDSELYNLYTLARRAKETNNIENAKKYYDMILLKDVNNWEPNFYSVYYQAMLCKLGGIVQAAIDVKNNVIVVGKMIATMYGTDKETINADIEYVVSEITRKLVEITNMFHGASFQHFCDCIGGPVDYAPVYSELCTQCSLIMYDWAVTIETYWGDKYGDYIALAYSTGIEYHKKMATKLLYQEDFEKQKQLILANAAIVQKYNPSYQIGNFKKDDNNPNKGGCYIATAVYGSYDCPEVWTLRRYRDYALYYSWYGKVFVKCYYAISPTLVKWFGNTEWFKCLWTILLNRIVAKLNMKGYDRTPYNDRKF